MREPSHPETAAIELTRVLYALSDPVRLDVVRQLDREGEASCTALDRGRPKSSMSHHFRVLRAAGVVRTRCEGTAHMNLLRRDELDRRLPGLPDAVPSRPQRRTVGQNYRAVSLPHSGVPPGSHSHRHGSIPTGT